MFKEHRTLTKKGLADKLAENLSISLRRNTEACEQIVDYLESKGTEITMNGIISRFTVYNNLADALMSGVNQDNIIQKTGDFVIVDNLKSYHSVNKATIIRD